MKRNKEINETRKLVKQAIFLHELRKYDLDDAYALPILDEELVKYSSEKGSLMQHKIIFNIKQEMDVETILSMLPYIRMKTDEELQKIANLVYASLKVFNSKKETLLQDALKKNDLKEANKIAKKNNAYIYLCEEISTLVVERVREKDKISILQGFSTGMLKFILKDVVRKKVKNEINYYLETDYEPKNEHALEEDGEYQQIVGEIERILLSRKYNLRDGKLQNYIQQIKEDERSKLEYI